MNQHKTTEKAMKSEKINKLVRRNGKLSTEDYKKQILYSIQK